MMFLYQGGNRTPRGGHASRAPRTSAKSTRLGGSLPANKCVTERNGLPIFRDGDTDEPDLCR